MEWALCLALVAIVIAIANLLLFAAVLAYQLVNRKPTNTDTDTEEQSHQDD